MTDLIRDMNRHAVAEIGAPSGSPVRLARIQQSTRAYMFIEVILIIGLFGGFLAWAALSTISGAVIASGTIKVEQGLKKIQHPTGGVISAINVKEGDAVETGDVLIRLDTQSAFAERAIYQEQLNALLARQARLLAERESRHFIPSVIERADGGLIPHAIIQGEVSLFEARRVALLSQKQVLNERKIQFDSEIKGDTVQIDAKQKEIELLQLELKGVEDLYAANLASVARVMPLRRELARSQGDLKVLATQIAQFEAKIDEVNVQIASLDQERLSEVNRDLQDIEPRIAELENRQTIASDVLHRAELRAPASGFVSQLSVHTIGGVVQPGEVVMQIVPRDSPLTVEANISPKDIDQVHLGGKTTLRLTAFNRRVTPELIGSLTTIAADAIRDERTGQSSYPVNISIPYTELTKLSGAEILPGMNAEVYIETVQRSVLSYLLKPALDQFAQVFREK